MIWLAVALAGDAMVEARRAEREGEPAAEWAACTQVLAEQSGTRDAATCERRLVYLSARRGDDGSFAALTALEAARRGADLDLDVATVGVPDVLRWEALLWASDEVEVTAALWDEVPRDHELFPRVATAHVDALVGEGRLDEAEAVEAEADRPRSAVPREGVALARQAWWKARIGWAAGVAAAGFLVPALPLAVRGWRGSTARPLGLAVWGAVVVLCALLAGAWEARAGVTVLWLGAALSAVHLVSAGALQARPHWIVRLGAGLATLGVAWWVLVWRGLL